MHFFKTRYVILLLKGIFTTITLTISSILFGSILALIFTYLSFNNKFCNNVIKFKTYLVKSTPMLVQIFLIYNGIGNIFQNHKFVLIRIIKSPFFCSLLALSINSSCYMYDIIKNSFLNIPKGNYLAARALGLTKYRIFSRIILPQALKSILPSYFNESTILLKATSLTSTISLLDIMGVSNKIISETYSIFDSLLVISFIYISLNILLNFSLSKINTFLFYNESKL